jgi:hypothetical protein
MRELHKVKPCQSSNGSELRLEEFSLEAEYPLKRKSVMPLNASDQDSLVVPAIIRSPSDSTRDCRAFLLGEARI